MGKRLLRIEKGELCGQEFLEGIVELIDRMLLECGKISVEEQNRFYSRRALEPAACAEAPSMRVSGISSVGTGECGFSLWKENRYLSEMKKMIDKKMAADGKAAFHLEFPKKKK